MSIERACLYGAMRAAAVTCLVVVGVARSIEAVMLQCAVQETMSASVIKQHSEVLVERRQVPATPMSHPNTTSQCSHRE